MLDGKVFLQTLHLWGGGHGPAGHSLQQHCVFLPGQRPHLRVVVEVPLGRLPLRPRLEGQGTSEKVLLAKP